MKKLLVVLLVLVMVISMAACGGSGNDSVKGDVLKLVLSHHCTEDDSHHLLAEAFAEKTAELSGGTMVLDVYANAQLFGQSDALAALRQGTLDITMTDVALFANYFPAASVLDLPYTFETREQAVALAETGEFLAYTQDALKEFGVRPLTLEPLDYRNALCTDMNVDNLEDFKGMIMRTPESPTIIGTFKAFGASPTVIPAGEAFTAVQTGVADALEGQVEYVVKQKFYEAAKNYVMTNHSMCFTSFSISLQAWDKLSEEQQEIITEAAKYAQGVQMDYTEELYPDMFAVMKEQGVKITEVDLAPFKAAAQSYVDSFIEMNDAQEAYDLVKKIID